MENNQDDDYRFVQEPKTETSFWHKVYSCGWYLALSFLVLWFFQPHNWLIFNRSAYESDYVATCVAFGDFKSEISSYEKEIRYFRTQYQRDEISYQTYTVLSQPAKRNIEKLNLLGENAYCFQEFAGWESPFHSKKYSEIREKINATILNMSHQ